MTGIEWKRITPDELIQDIEISVKLHRENKYAFQVGLRDLDFHIDEDFLKTLGLTVPFQSIALAEDALNSKAITPVTFIEFDQTEHQVLCFDARPVGFSGFMNCVTHSLALTNMGLFEVGRYAAVSQNGSGRIWQWFLHRRLAEVEEVERYITEHSVTPAQYMDEVYHAMAM